MNLIKHSFLVLCLTLNLALLCSAQETFSAKVVGVVDGDTVTVMDKNFRQITVRLAGIDAPEKQQDFGNVSKEFLAKLIFEKKVTIVAGKTDKYGRMIGKILLDGKDINLAMVEAGLAWHYKEYEDEQSAEDREKYAQAEINARKSLAGLWQQSNAVKPSDFRKSKTTDSISIPPLTAGGRTPLNILVEQTTREIPITSTESESSETNVTTQTPPSSSNKTVQVRGYTRKDGTYVPPHTRTAPRRKN